MPDSESTLIVIVEDDLSMIQAMERILRLGGHVTRSYQSAEALLAQETLEDVACLVFDVQLPGLTGFELHSRLVDRGRVPPVIFITAFDDPGWRAKAGEVEAVAFLTKPFSGKTLLRTIELALAGG